MNIERSHTAKAWFDVDREGLARLTERRGSHWILSELLQNAWDAPDVTSVTVSVEPAGRGMTRITVEDDSPVGFSDLTHAFTLFAESGKKSDPSKRGRFNLGEKLVLSLCQRAEIETTKGTVIFDPDGRRNTRSRRAKGTAFRAVLRVSKNDAEAAIEAVRSFIPPDGIVTIVNGVELERRTPFRTFECTLPTEAMDVEGKFGRTRRKTEVRLHRAPSGREGTVYEMGIPVCEIEGRFDVDIMQKVPLSFERDALLPSFLRDVRVAVLNNASSLIEEADLASVWVGHAISADGAEPDAVGDVLVRRFGERIVSFDPNDREANDRAVAAGYTVLSGGTFSKSQWQNIKATGIVRPAGQVMPTPKPFNPDGPPAEFAVTTPEMRRFAGFVRAFAKATIGAEIDVTYLKTFNATAAYGGRRMSFNVGRLGTGWFEGPLRQEQVDLVIHELGHEFEGNHLSTRYNDALTEIAAKAVMLALKQPDTFDLSRYDERLHV